MACCTSLMATSPKNSSSSSFRGIALKTLELAISPTTCKPLRYPCACVRSGHLRSVVSKAIPAMWRLAATALDVELRKESRAQESGCRVTRALFKAWCWRSLHPRIAGPHSSKAWHCILKVCIHRHVGVEGAHLCEGLFLIGLFAQPWRQEMVEPMFGISWCSLRA